MVQDLIVKKSLSIKAPASLVWKALTDPEMVKQYFFGTTLSCDWKEGSPIIFRGIWEGKEYEDKGTILKIIPGKFVKYNYWSNFSGTEDTPDNYANITYALEEKGEETVLTVSQDGFKDKKAMDHSYENWGSILNEMKKLVESTN